MLGGSKLCIYIYLQIYRYFDDELRDIIEGNCPARYPIICSEVTQQFTVVSTSINHIKVKAADYCLLAIRRNFKRKTVTHYPPQDLLITRGKTELSASISKIQSLEKEKLLLVAAHHLDQLKSTVLSGTENVTGSKTPEQVAYLAKQILTCQQQIAECMEEIQCHLCDLVEEE